MVPSRTRSPARDHNLTVPSWLAPARRAPSALRAAPYTGPLWPVACGRVRRPRAAHHPPAGCPCRVVSSRPLGAPPHLLAPSWLAPATRRPSALSPTPYPVPECPCRVANSFPPLVGAAVECPELAVRPAENSS